MADGPIVERNQDATIYVGSLDEKVDSELLWDLFIEAGPVVNVHLPKDKINGAHHGYGFVEFMSEADADYAVKIMNMIKLYGKPIRVNKASAHNKKIDVGANLFIKDIHSEVDEKLLYDTFSAFGVILQTPKIVRDPESGNLKGIAFVNYATFEAADAAIEAMDGQYLCNRAIKVSYAFKKDSNGVKHGSAAERLLAARNPLRFADRPNQYFADTSTMANAFFPPAPEPPCNMMPPNGLPPMPPMPSMPPMGVMPPANYMPQMGYMPNMGSMPHFPPMGVMPPMAMQPPQQMNSMRPMIPPPPMIPPSPMMPPPPPMGAIPTGVAQMNRLPPPPPPPSSMSQLPPMHPVPQPMSLPPGPPPLNGIPPGPSHLPPPPPPPPMVDENFFSG